MRIDIHDEGYSFEYPLNLQTDVRVTVSNNDQVTIIHYRDDKQINIVPSPEEKEKWLQKVEDIKLERLKIYSWINKIDELLSKIDLLKEEILSILDPVVEQSGQLPCDHLWKSRFNEKRGSYVICSKCSEER